jgi:hypothetical protein
MRQREIRSWSVVWPGLYARSLKCVMWKKRILKKTLKPHAVGLPNAISVCKNCIAFVYRKLVMVCSRVNLCNNWCIFWLSETTKSPLGFALYTQGISFWTEAFQRVYKCVRDRLRRIWVLCFKKINLSIIQSCMNCNELQWMYEYSWVILYTSWHSIQFIRRWTIVDAFQSFS